MTDILGMVRNPDWDTSIEAALSVAPHVSWMHEYIYRALWIIGPMTDEEIENMFTGLAYSTARKRRCELCDMHLVQPVGVKKNSRNRNMIVWGIND